MTSQHRFYHRTSTEFAREILEQGFREGAPGTYPRPGAGIWLTDEITEPGDAPPWGCDAEGEGCHALLRVDLVLSEEEIASYRRESRGEGYDYEVPATVIRERGTVGRITTYSLRRRERVLESFDEPDEAEEDPLKWAAGFIPVYLGELNAKGSLVEEQLQLWRGDSSGERLIAVTRPNKEGGWILVPLTPS